MLFGVFFLPRGAASRHPLTGPIVARLIITRKFPQLDIWCQPKQRRLNSHITGNLLVADAMMALQLRTQVMNLGSLLAFVRRRYNLIGHYAQHSCLPPSVHAAPR